MDTQSNGFPHELLTQPWPARLEYFKSYTALLTSSGKNSDASSGKG